MARLNYNHLRYFWTVAHEGKLTRAAERLNVSQSALSIQIQKLEAQLGQALFERRGRQLLLTEAGRIVLDHADAIFAMGEELMSTLEGVQSGRLILRVGAIATLSRNFQVRFLGPLLRRDDVEIVLRSGTFAELMRHLEAHAIDVLLANFAPPRDAASDWIAHSIAEQPVSLIGHRERVHPGLDLHAALTAEPLLLPSFDSSIRAGFDALVARLGLRPRIAAEVDDMAMLRLLARENLGLAVVPPIVVSDELQSGLLVDIGRLEDLSESFYAITLKRRFPNPLLGELLAPAEGA